MNKPCNECPFRKTSTRGFLADYTPELLHNIVMNEQHFPCHKTLPNVESLTPNNAKKYPRCTGSLLYMKKGCKLPGNLKTKKILDEFTKEELDQVLSVPEFFKHHNLNK